MSYTIVCTIVYILIIALVYAPKCPKYETVQDAPIDYFPEIEEVVKEPENTINQGQATDKTDLHTLPVNEVKNAQVNLSKMSIRSLKKLASEMKVKNYGKMCKADLIHILESTT